ncbi:MAG: aldehyde dehydrogenase family protein, partial [Rhodospirillaceae bacterium]|nr:aldehyde dehydrogenase family protein [Rhodospirillaceae bacterium]
MTRTATGTGTWTSTLRRRSAQSMIAVFPPTVIDHVHYDSQLVYEETFGPAIPIIRCKDLDEIIPVANSTPF